MKKFLVGLTLFLTIIISVLIQINLLNIVTLAGTAANMGIILVVAIGLMCDKTLGGVIGIIYGLIMDVIFGKALGFYVLLYMMLGYTCGRIGRVVSRENKTTLVVMIGISTLVFEIASYILRNDYI